MEDVTQPEQGKADEHKQDGGDPLRGAVEAAYDKAEKEAAPSTAPAPAAKAAAAPAPAPTRDPATGKFTSGRAEAKAPAAPAPSPTVGPAAATAPAAAEPDESGAEPPAPDKPPQSWRPAAKALWGKLPPEFAPVKAEVQRLERERETVLREAAGSRRVAETFAEVVRPYEGFIRAAGHTPMQSVAELMRTAAALRVGSEQDRATLVAGIIRAHGVNPDLVFSVLSGEGPLPGAPQQPQQPQEFRDPRVDELLEEARAARAEATRAAEAAADTELDAFLAKNPLADDQQVQLRMARAIDLAREDGVDLSYEEAYAGVVAADPELRAVVEQQRAAGAATNPLGSTARAEAAASSIKASPVTQAPPPLRGRPLQEHVEAAYEKASRKA